MADIRNDLKLLMESKGYTINEIAELLNVSASTIVKYLSGKE